MKTIHKIKTKKTNTNKINEKNPQKKQKTKKTKNATTTKLNKHRFVTKRGQDFKQSNFKMLVQLSSHLNTLQFMLCYNFSSTVTELQRPPLIFFMVKML